MLIQMPAKNQIILFLQNFHVKMEIWGIVVGDDRGKNTQTMLDLEISKDYRNKVLKELTVEDYSDGPLPENLHGGSDMWVFGKLVKERKFI